MKTWNIEIQRVKAMNNANGLIRAQIDALVQTAAARDDGVPTTVLQFSEDNARVLMLGRGMVSDPGLALAIVAEARGQRAEFGWAELQPLLAAFWTLVCGHIEPRARAGRLKQWLNYLRRRHPQADEAYQAVRTINDPQRVAARLGLVPVPRTVRCDEELLEVLA